MREGMNQPTPIQFRELTTSWTNRYGQQKTEVDMHHIQTFGNEVATSINGLVEHVNYIHRRLGDIQHIDEFMNWIDLAHPELRRDFITSQRVAKRLAPDDGAVMESAG